MVAVYAFYLIAYIIRKMDKKFKRIYYSDGGYWRGKSAIQRLAKASGSTKEEAEKWLLKQPLYQIYLPLIASRYKGSYQLTSKYAKEVAQAFQWIYENTPLTYPKTLIIDDGKEFYGDTTKLMEKHDVIMQRGDPSQHRSQGIVERFNRMLADRPFVYLSVPQRIRRSIEE